MHIIMKIWLGGRVCSHRWRLGFRVEKKVPQKGYQLQLAFYLVQRGGGNRCTWPAKAAILGQGGLRPSIAGLRDCKVQTDETQQSGCHRKFHLML